MRKFFYTLGIIAASALAFSACQKEQEIKEEPQSGKLVTISFTAEKAGTETRTGIATEGDSQVSYKWTDEDASNIKLFTVDGSTLTQVANPTITKVSDTKLTISATVEANATYTFRALLSGDYTGTNQLRIKSNQNPSIDGFDPKADILVSEDKTVSVGENGGSGDMLLTFHRQVVVNKMTLKNLTAGETIKRVVISSENYLTGYFDSINGNWTGESKSITLNYNDLVISDGGLFPVYFVTKPDQNHSLTVEVTTNQRTYQKSFAEGKTIDFTLGQFTKFNVALSTSSAITALTLPIEDSMEWAVNNNGNDSTNELNAAEDINVTQGEQKVYDSVNKAFKGGTGLKLGSGNANGSITTNPIDLSSAFYVAVDAKDYGSDGSKLIISVGSSEVFTSETLSAEYKTYYINCSAVSSPSSVTIATDKKRCYIKNLVIAPGTYVIPPVINVMSDNPIEVANTASSQTISYTISNETGATLTATTEASWITNLNTSTSGQVTFSVSAQETGAEARSAEITLSYPGANSQTITVNQAAGIGGATTYAYSFTSASWAATLDGAPANWTSGKNGAGYSNSGIQVTTGASGANGTSPVSFTDIEEIVITYCTNSSNGVGSIKVTVGNGATKTFNVTKPSSGGTTPKTSTFSYSTKESGNVKIEVTCTTNSIYLIGASIKAASMGGTNPPQPTSYLISLSDVTNGSISADKTTATEGDVVTLTATPSTGYVLDAWTVTDASNNPVTVTDNSFTMPASNVSVSATFIEIPTGATQHIATISFGTKKVTINSANVTGGDSEGNTWTITTVGTTSFTANAEYYQVGSSSKPATSITFTTTLPKSASDISLEAKLGGFSGTAGTVNLKVGDDVIGSGSLNATNDVIVTSNSTASGTVLTVTITGISKGVKCYYIKATYTN